MSEFTFKNPPTADMMDWIMNGDLGTSSMTMLAFHLGTPRERVAPPCDEWDMHRCIKLVDQCPEIRESFEGLGQTDPVWEVILPQWDELCKVYREQGLGAMGGLFRKIVKTITF